MSQWENRRGRKHIRTSIDDGKSAWGRRGSKKVGEGVVEVASLNSAPAGDAGVLVGRLNDFDLCGGLVGFDILFYPFNAAWRWEVSL